MDNGVDTTEERQQMILAIGNRCAAFDYWLRIRATQTNDSWPSDLMKIIRDECARLILGVATGKIPLEHESLDPFRDWLSGKKRPNN